jgi:carbon starvation protein CstA
VLVLGVLLVWDGPWSFSDLWLLIGLAGWIASFGVGFLFIRPEGEKLKEIAAQYGPTSAELQRRARRLGLVSRVQLLALFLVVADMVLKPTSDDPWTLVVLAAILIAAALVAATSLRRPLAATARATEP